MEELGLNVYLKKVFQLIRDDRTVNMKGSVQYEAPFRLGKHLASSGIRTRDSEERETILPHKN